MAKTRRSRDKVFIGQGGVQQEGPLPKYVCNRCEGPVVWATSRRTGRKYLANVVTNSRNHTYYLKHSVHDCEADDARRAGYAAERDAELVAEIQKIHRERRLCTELVASTNRVCDEPGALDTRLDETYHLCGDHILDRIELTPTS